MPRRPADVSIGSCSSLIRCHRRDPKRTIEAQSQGDIMPLKKEANGRRSIQVEVEVPGTPEDVWAAIATGPGITAWFVPTEMEPGPGGVPAKMTLHFGPGMDSVATITGYDAPRRLTAEDSWGPG